MTILQAIILGIVQGATEFLPISSTAHLVLVPTFLGWEFDPEVSFAFDVLVQLGTIVAVIIYFRADLWKITTAMISALWERAPFRRGYARLGWLIVIATFPAVIIGLLFKDFFKDVFENPTAVAGLLLVTAALLTISERVSQERVRRLRSVGWADALVMGILQALAIFPGISRSGATIAGGLFRGLDRPTAARFSFLMAVPIMIGASLLALRDMFNIRGVAAALPIIAVGFVTSGLVGFLSIRWLLGYLQKRSLNGFAVHCTLLALAGLLAACTPTVTAVAQRTFPIGATASTRSLAEQWTRAYKSDFVPKVSTYPSLRRLVDGLQSSEIVAGVAFATPAEAELVATSLATTTLNIVVHPENPVTNLTAKEVQAVFTGAISNWNELGGADLKIEVISREDGADTRRAFDELALENLRPTLNAIAAPADEAVIAFVAESSNAIGYVPTRFVDESVKSLQVEGRQPASDANYALTTDLLALTLEQPQGELRAWMVWVQEGFK